MTQKPLDNTLLANFSAGDIEGFEALVEIALDMRWSWNHAADQIWRRIDHHLWEQSHNPWDLLQTVSRNKIACSAYSSANRVVGGRILYNYTIDVS